MKRYLLILALLAPFCRSFGQMATSYRAEAFGSMANGAHTPFWMVNQHWGIVPIDADNFYLRGAVSHEQTIDEDWSFDAGIDLAGANMSDYGNPWIQQLYGRVNWKIWRLDIGSREDYTSFLNPRLSSGDFAKSNNARPAPEIKGSIPEFILIPYTKGNMFLKGECAVGYYLDSNWKEKRAYPKNQSYTTDLLTHHKSIHFRFGDIVNKNKMQFTVGLDHVALWGGKLHKFNRGKQVYNDVQTQPHGILDLLRVAIAKEGSASASATDQAYVSGSQWGAYIIKYDYRLNANDLLSIYTNHFFDDGSGMTFENYPDGLFGIEYRSKKKSWISGAVFEYVYTKHQTGPVHHNIAMDDEHRDKLIHRGNGNDNYYNNVDYIEGPSYFGRTIGTPLFLSPVYNTDGSVNFKNSRIIAFHLGVEGYLHPALQYRLLLTTGQGWGRYYVPFTSVKKGFASQLELTYTPPQIEGLEVKIAGAYDRGEFFGGDTFGGGITLCQRGILCKK